MQTSSFARTALCIAIVGFYLSHSSSYRCIYECNTYRPNNRFNSLPLEWVNGAESTEISVPCLVSAVSSFYLLATDRYI